MSQITLKLNRQKKRVSFVSTTVFRAAEARDEETTTGRISTTCSAVSWYPECSRWMSGFLPRAPLVRTLGAEESYVCICMYKRSQWAGERNFMIYAEEKNKWSIAHIGRLHICNAPTLAQPTNLHTTYTPTNFTPYAPTYIPTLQTYTANLHEPTHYQHTNLTKAPTPYILTLPYTPTNPCMPTYLPNTTTPTP